VGVLLALGSAFNYGLSDYVGGVASRRASFLRIAMLGQIGALVVVGLAAPVVSPEIPALADLAWGGLSGVGTAIGMTFLFRGMGRGAVSIVVPTSAVGGVVLPVLVGVLVLGERPEPLAWLGIVITLPALWVISRGNGDDAHAARMSVLDGLVASVGIALQYLALAQAGPDSGIWAVASGRVTSIVTVLVLGMIVPAQHIDAIAGDGEARRATAGGLLAGVLAGAALVCYLYATRVELITVAVVVASLYPVVPVILGVTVLRERLSRGQSAGLVAAMAATVMIASA
jgi:drug/metabolite transporter (DMT)-like permease